MSEKHKSDSGHFSSAYGLKSKDQTLGHYRSWAETYDLEVGEQNGYAQPQRTAEMLKRFRPETSQLILDAGCGSGLSGVALATAGYKNIHGCDFSTEMLQKSIDKNCYSSLFEADLNLGQPNIPESTYDAITCVGVFSFGHVFPAACDDLLRMLKPNGLLIIALNEKYWNEGKLQQKIDQLVGSAIVDLVAKEFGDHLPGHGVNGWVLALQKN